MEKRKLARATTVVATTSALVALGGPAYVESSMPGGATVLDVATFDHAARDDAESGIPVTVLGAGWRDGSDKERPSEEPAGDEELPATGNRVGLAAAVGSSVLLTGALAFLAARGRRRMLRGAAYW